MTLEFKFQLFPNTEMRSVLYGVRRPAVSDELKVRALYQGTVIEGLSTGTCTFASEFKTEGKRRADLSIYRELQAVTLRLAKRLHPLLNTERLN